MQSFFIAVVPICGQETRNPLQFNLTFGLGLFRFGLNIEKLIQYHVVVCFHERITNEYVISMYAIRKRVWCRMKYILWDSFRNLKVACIIHGIVI